MPYPVRAMADPGWIRARAARAGQKVRALFMGGDFPRKGGPDLLEAWRAGGFFYRAALDLVTDWPMSEGDLPPGVRLVGGIAPYTPSWLDLWRGADLFVMPTRHEAFGMVFQEAAAAGLPSIATRINAIPEIVQDGATGILVASGDRAGLVRAIQTLVDSAELRRTMGAVAFDRIRVLNAPARYASRLEALMHSVLDQHERHQT